MSSEIEILQQSFMQSMESMQKSFEKEKKELEDKITQLKKENKSLKNMNSNSEQILLQLKEKEENENIFKEELMKNSNEINTLKSKNKELTKKNEENLKNLAKLDDLEKQVAQLYEYKTKTNELNNQINVLKNQFYLEEKLKKQFKEEKEKLEKMISAKDEELNKLNESIKKYENQNKELLEYVKKAKENEEKMKLEEEKMKNEKEKFEKYKIEEEKKRKDDEKRKKEEEEKIKNQEKKSNEMTDEKKNKLLIDILCEFFLKLNNSQYFLTVFDLLNKCLKNFDELNYFAKMSIKFNRPINDLLFNFYSNLRSYIILTGNNSALNNFLTQKVFKYSEIGKDDIETLKKIRNIKLGDNNNILDIYKKKKELFFQRVGLTFDLLKDKILNDETKNSEYPDFLKLNKPPTELNVNFDNIDINTLSPFISFQISNIFSKLEILSIETSKVNLDIFYSLIFNCVNLKSLKIKLNDKLSMNNVEILNNMISIIFTYLKNIVEFSYDNVPLLNKYLPGNVLSIKNSKLKKLTLNACFNSKEDVAMFNSYFSGPNDLEEIDFSNHTFNIPVLLGNSLLNYEINKKLTSINFNSCCLKDEDIEIISKYITDNNLVKYCNLGNNEISQKSCFKLGTVIEKNNFLEKLILNNCKLNGETLNLLFNRKGSCGLKYININDNEIGDIGLVGISSFIKTSPKLEVFELCGVGGTDMGFSTLINCIKTVGNIKEIHFVKNTITKSSIDLIKGYNEDFKNKGVKFFVNKIEGENENEILKFCNNN